MQTESRLALALTLSLGERENLFQRWSRITGKGVFPTRPLMVPSVEGEGQGEGEREFRLNYSFFYGAHGVTRPTLPKSRDEFRAP